MERIITTMKIMYFIAQKDLSISSYEDMCAFAFTMKMANMPKSLEYSSQTSRYVALEYLNAISTYLTEMQVKRACDSPFFSIMIDESTDRSLEIHLIIYCVYFTHGGRGKKVSEFMGITCINDGRGKTIYDVVKSFLIDKGFDLQKLIGIATDGASAMIGSEIGMISFFKKDCLSLIAIHCIAHREALAIADASKGFADLLNVEKLANKIYSLINNSSKRNKELMDSFYSMAFSRARCNFITLFCLHLLPNVLKVVNALNQKLQEDIIDLTSIGTTIDITIRQLYRTYINCENFGNVWLERLLQHLLDFQELFEHALYTIDKKGCEKELYSFVDNLFMNCEGFTMKEAWRYFSSMKDWHASFPNLMKLWQVILIIPTSTDACERGFSKQNLIKSDRRSRLTVNTLDHLMRVSTIGPNIDEVDSNCVFELWKESKRRRMYDL
ncbi:hypothetical protein KP509_27G035000 [Ceratopteris richardii]|uniref:HAT C-terminal dimerisation domain-containing protein n=1 Tax=Ceratopteris richardii TaxID=49495 RepID=A0A8T2RH64_CERRI|nr:hypothetical protein KP509_27G035000 [Ceratopteris richardii]